MANDIPENLAAEFALGILEGSRYEQAKELFNTDPEFSAEVEAWQNHLAPLSEALPPAVVSDNVLKVIENRLDNEIVKNRPATGISDQVGFLQNRLNIWKIAAISFGTATAALAVTIFFLLVPFSSNSVQQQYVAVLRDDKGQEGFIVTLEHKTGRMIVTSLDMRPPPSKSYELWVMHENNGKPATLGLVAMRPYVNLNSPEVINRIKELEGVKLAVSLEPEGGAPKGQSMGQVMFAGKFIMHNL